MGRHAPTPGRSRGGGPASADASRAARAPSGSAQRARGASALCLVAILLASCAVRERDPEEWLRVGYRTPRQALASFQSALSADLIELERRSFSRDFARRNSLSSVGYRVVREELMDEHPYLPLVADGEVIQEDVTEDGRAVLVVRVGNALASEQVVFELVRDEFYEVWAAGLDPDAAWEDDFTDLRGALTTRVDDDGALWLDGSVPGPEDVALDEITELRIGSEWKIDDIRSPSSDDSAPGAAPQP